MTVGELAALLPQYRCHKVVRAAEILSARTLDEKQSLLYLNICGCSTLHITVPNTLFARYAPEKGDFYIIYDDGYASISPRGPFKEGYDLL
jgi:hypothetical protein